MRSTAVMNGVTAVTDGLDCLIRAYSSEPGAQLKEAIDACFSRFLSELTNLFGSWIPTIKQTYIISVSEHPREEDPYGRLPMWRAHGGHTGVAFIFNAPLARHSEALKAYSGPVAYFAGDRVAVDMSKIAAHLREQSELCRRPINA